MTKSDILIADYKMSFWRGNDEKIDFSIEYRNGWYVFFDEVEGDTFIRGRYREKDIKNMIEVLERRADKRRGFTQNISILPTIIDAVGDYITRNGGKVTIDKIEDRTTPDATGYLWKEFRGKFVPRRFGIWHVSGRKYSLTESPNDIIGKA